MTKLAEAIARMRLVWLDATTLRVSCVNPDAYAGRFRMATPDEQQSLERYYRERGKAGLLEMRS
jgi:hypothetical protein